MFDLSQSHKQKGWSESLQGEVTLEKIRKDLDKVAKEAKSAGKDATKAVMD